MRLLLVIWMLVSPLPMCLGDSDEENNEERIKRQVNSIPLIYPFGGTYKLLVGFGTPVKVEPGIQLIFGGNFQYQYVQFQNITELSQYYFIKEVSREQRDADIQRRMNERFIFYYSLAEMMNTKGFNGHECVLRMICEAAQFPVEGEGLIGELMHILLTPDYGRSAFDEEDPDWEETMSMYKDAAVAGREMFSCPHIYRGCPETQSVLGLITTLRDE